MSGNWAEINGEGTTPENISWHGRPSSTFRSGKSTNHLCPTSFMKVHQARVLRSYLVHTICIRILSHRISIGSRYLHHVAELSARKTHTRFKMPTKIPLPYSLEQHLFLNQGVVICFFFFFFSKGTKGRNLWLCRNIESFIMRGRGQRLQLTWSKLVGRRLRSLKGWIFKSWELPLFVSSLWSNMWQLNVWTPLTHLMYMY